jgi:AcrR family transcriptional regulator
MASTVRNTTHSRGSLTPDLIASEALALIESEGMEGFSTRKLGMRLHCEAMSIYHHYPSKAHLMDALVDRTLSEIALPSRTLTASGRVRHLAAEWRKLSRRHPKFYLWMALHRWNTPTGVRFLAEVLDSFHAANLSADQAAKAFRALGYYLLGATLEETSGYAHGPSAMNPMSEEDVKRLYPDVAIAGKYFSPDHFDEIFETGLGILLRGLGVETQQEPG